MGTVYDSIMQGLHEVVQDIAGAKKLPRDTISIVPAEQKKEDKKTDRHGKGNKAWICSMADKIFRIYNLI